MPSYKYVHDSVNGDRFEKGTVLGKTGQIATTEEGFHLWCPLCHPFVTGYSYVNNEPFKVVDGESYCLKHYPQMVDVYLADLRLKELQPDLEGNNV